MPDGDSQAACHRQPLVGTTHGGYGLGMATERIEDSSVIELDDRGRTNLRRFGGRPRGRYLVSVRPDGAIVLQPAVAMTVHEAAMWREHPELMREISDHVSGVKRTELVTIDIDAL